MPRSNKSNPQNLDRNAYQALLDKLIPSQLFKKRKYPTNNFKEFRFVDTYRAHAEDKQIAPAFRVFFAHLGPLVSSLFSGTNTTVLAWIHFVLCSL